MSGPWEKFQQKKLEQKAAEKPWEKFKPKAPMTREQSVQDEYNSKPWYSQLGQAADDTARLLANGMTLGFADKFAGYMGGEGTEAERAKSEDALTRAGYAGTAAEIVGSMIPATKLAQAGLTAGRLVPAGMEGVKGLIARSLAMGVDGAALGTAQAYGNDTDPVTGALVGAGAGAVGNAIGEGLSAGASKLAGLFNQRPTILSPEELRAAANAAYQRADDAGVVFSPDAINRLKGTVYDDMAEFGFHPNNQPGAATAFDELSRLSEGGNVSMKGLDTARKVAQGGFRTDNKSNNELLRRIVDRIDEFPQSVRPEDVLTGDASSASAALSEGRDLWGRVRKMEKVDELLSRAGLNAGSSGSGGNVENATRQQLKRLLTDKKIGRGFKKDEIAAIEKAVIGTPTQNALRLAGKLSPQGNGLMLWLMGAGSVAAPQVTVPAMVAGYGAKKTSEAMTRSSAKRLKDLIAVGGSKAALEGPKNAFQKLAESKRDALARALMMAIMGTAATNQ